jgi:hypothetical protein
MADESTNFTINLDEHRPQGATTWELPPWGHPLSLGVFPLLIDLGDRLIPIGTAFCISRVGVVATASHVLLEEALKIHPLGQRILRESRFPKNIDLKKFGDARFFLLHSHWTSPGQFQVNLWPLERANGVLVEGEDPTDLTFGFPKFQQEFPYTALPISFAVPRIGSKVKCVGYSRTEIPGGEIPIEDLQRGRIGDWFNYYRHSFRVVEGTVTKIFTQGFARNFVRGACFAINAEIEQGQSGGPVFNEAGYVCGVISAGATLYFPQPASLISLLYPALTTEITFGFSMGPVRMNATRPLFSLIETGGIKTDGSEELVTLIPENGSWRVGPMIHEDDGSYVFDNFSSHQEDRPSTPEGPMEYYRIRRRQTDNEES